MSFPADVPSSPIHCIRIFGYSLNHQAGVSEIAEMRSDFTIYEILPLISSERWAL